MYNSNPEFLMRHTGRDRVTHPWIRNELAAMKGAGFVSGKIVEKLSRDIVGVIDFQVAKESYLSLLMLHAQAKNRGYGRQLYEAFEFYACRHQSTQIRLDVVTDYNDAVLRFWSKSGFHRYKDIELDWAGVVLPAVVMKKDLRPPELR